MATPDLSEFEQLARQQSSQRRPCKVAEGLDALHDGERANAEAALTADKAHIPSGAIEKWFLARGLKVPLSSLTAHRGRRCTCADG